MSIISTDNFEFRKLSVPTSNNNTRNKTRNKNTLYYYYRFLDKKWHKCDIKQIETVLEPTAVVIFSGLDILKKAEYLSSIITKSLKKDLALLDDNTDMLPKFQHCFEKCLSIIQETYRILDEPIESPSITCYIFSKNNFSVLHNQYSQNFLQRGENDLFRITTNKYLNSDFLFTNIRFFKGDSFFLKSSLNDLQLFKTQLFFGPELIKKQKKKDTTWNINWIVSCISIITFLAWLIIFIENKAQYKDSTEKKHTVKIEINKKKTPQINYINTASKQKKVFNSQAIDLAPIESEKQQILQKRSELLNDSTAREELDALTEQYIKLEKKQKRLER